MRSSAAFLRLGFGTLLVVLVVAVAGCGGSSDHSSEWTPGDIHTAEASLEGKVGKSIAACVVGLAEKQVTPKKGLEGTPSGSEKKLGENDLNSCVAKAVAVTSGHTGEWDVARTQELENLLVATGVTDTSCYVKFVENRIPPVGTEQLKGLSEKAGKEAAESCKGAEEAETNKSLEEQHELENPSTAPESETEGTTEETQTEDEIP
jgi:hypothetical protein